MTFRFPTEIVAEGTTKILVPKLEAFVKEIWEYAPSKAPVFYNPAMALNRDIAVLALQTYQRMVKRKLVCCEPLAGCGVRGVRLANEVEGVTKVVINDINPEAARLAEYNVKLNNLGAKVHVDNEDANFLLTRYAAPRRRFDYVDIDPFGSPVPYLDSALRAVRDGGLIALTATDMAPLCGVHPIACIRKYGGKPLRTEYCHELAVRLLLGCLAMQAAKHDIGVQPVFSYSEYNYVRVYAIVNYGAKQADKNVENLGYVSHCFSCFHRETEKGLIPHFKNSCPECGSKFHVAGPLWLGTFWNLKYCMKMRDEVRQRNMPDRMKIYKMMSLIVGEVDGPLTYFVIDKMCDKFDLPVPSWSKVSTELRKSGFQAVSTHFNSKGIRTDAPANIVKQVISKSANIWVRKHGK